MADVGPFETEKLDIAKMGAESNGQQPEKAEEKGENEAGEDDEAQDGESGKNNSEKEQECEVRVNTKSEEGRAKRTWNSPEGDLGKKKAEHVISEAQAAAPSSAAPNPSAWLRWRDEVQVSGCSPA